MSFWRVKGGEAGGRAAMRVSEARQLKKDIGPSEVDEVFEAAVLDIRHEIRGVVNAHYSVMRGKVTDILRAYGVYEYLHLNQEVDDLVFQLDVDEIARVAAKAKLYMMMRKLDK